MNNGDGSAKRAGIFLPPGQGRSYPMGRISAVFKADGGETQNAYSISEWWLEPHTAGPGAHAHPEDDVFYVIEGTMSYIAPEQARGDHSRVDRRADIYSVGATFYELLVGRRTASGA